MKKSLALLALLAEAACGGKAGTAGAAPPQWRAIASADDRERIRSWRDTWELALAKASPAHGAEIAAAGTTLQPDAALPDPTPPSGAYGCRIFKVGGLTPANPDFSVTPPRACKISMSEEGQPRFVMIEGAQRPIGILFPDRNQRLILLGSLILSDERKSMRYGTDSERNVVGIMERVAPGRWRLVLPSPRWEAKLEVIELTPEG